jgi:hypothetical protein
VTCEKPLLQAAAWEIYSDLAVMSSAQDGSLLPFALNAVRESGGEKSLPYCLFVFEHPRCVPLLPLLGAGLAVGARRSADVVLLWASQLGKAYSAMRSKESGGLLKRKIAMGDIFIRDVSELFETMMSILETM